MANLRHLLWGAALAGILGSALAVPALAQRQGDDIAILHDQCVALARTKPQEALTKAQQWRESGGGFVADHCIGMALFQLKDYAGAAKRFEQLATAMMQMPSKERATTLAQAGQAWLAAGEPLRGRADFDAAIALDGENTELLIDRAEAFAASNQFWEAIDDLNRAIEKDPNRADAYIYRGSAYRFVDALDLAAEDIDRGLKLAPDAVLGLLERGNLHRLKGDVAGAKKDWERIVQLAPQSRAAIAARQNLAHLADANTDKPGPRRKPAETSQQ